MAHTIEIIVKDDNGVVITETIITTPNLSEAEDVKEELDAFIQTSPLISAYEHIGNRPDDR